ncbi:apolipoprotein N-acyltransferase [Alteromonadaceae bacterium BrNp21-10]|nr:apolipoprotein N-acyltransferase [Alteromonadaceae bacterium BrNp21-10]
MNLLLALVAGASLTLGFAPFSLWFVVPVGVGLFAYLLQLPSTQKPALLGWMFGLGWFGAGISWIHVSIATHGGLPIILSLGLMLLLCGYLALFPALFSFILKRYFAIKHWPLVVAALWLFCEWLRSWLFTGFPWLSLGYSQLHGPLAGWIPIIGETGVSALVMLIAVSAALGIANKQFKAPLSLIVIMLLSGWVLNQHDWATPTGKVAQVSMVQGNIKQELRWVPEQDRPTMEKYLKITESLWSSDIIIWPEAAIPKLEPLAQEYLMLLDAKAAEQQTGLITGILNYNFENQQAFNGMVVLGSKQAGSTTGSYQYNHDNRYAKHHLLPIGEFIPLEDWIRGLAPIFDLPMSSFTRGDFLQPNLQANGYLLAAALCYEIAFPRQLTANLHDNTDFILTVSNDAWFGASHGPHQHLEIAQVRAKEFGLPVLRGTNNGVTAFVDHRGQIIQQAPQFEASSISSPIAVVRGNTPYRLFGDNIIWIIAMIGLGLANILIRQEKSKKAQMTEADSND